MKAVLSAIRATKVIKQEIDHYMKYPHSVCGNCKFRKECYGNIAPKECLECGFLNQRNEPYFVDIPVYKEANENDQ